MADFGPLMTRRGLGAPPPIDEASNNLLSPELAPAPSPAPPLAAVPGDLNSVPLRRDGRSARKTHRTVPFATRVSVVFDNRLRDIALRDDLLLVEVLERALDAYEKEQAAS